MRQTAFSRRKQRESTFSAPAVQNIASGTQGEQNKVNVVLVVNNKLSSTPAGTSAFITSDSTATPTIDAVVKGAFQATVTLNAGDTVNLATANSLIADPTKNLLVQFSGMFLQQTS